MFGGIDPKKISGMMKKMGINQEEINATRVIIEKEDGKLIIENPNVVKISMQGQDSFQITGEVREESNERKNREQDIQTIIEKTGASREKAEKALSETGDLAEAILSLS